MEDIFSFDEDSYESKYSTVLEATSIGKIIDDGYIVLEEDLSESIGSNLLVPPMGEVFSISGVDGAKTLVKPVLVSPFVDKDKEISKGTQLSLVRTFSKPEMDYLSMIDALALKAKDRHNSL